MEPTSEDAMKPDARRKFGRVDLEVTAFAFGTAPIGNIFREIDEATSDCDVRARLGRGRPLLRHRADVWPRACRNCAPARRCAGSGGTISCCPPRSAACSGPPGASSDQTSRHGSTPRPSRWNSTTATTARCGPSRTAFSAWRWSGSTSSSSMTSTFSRAARTSPRCSGRRWTAAGGARETALRQGVSRPSASA